MLPNPSHDGARRFSFEKGRRVRKRSEFAAAQSGAQRFSTKHLVFLVSARTAGGTEPSRLGLIVSRRAGNAVQRNRIKRLCRELFRTARTPLPAGIDLIVIAKAEAGGVASESLSAEWATAAPAISHRAREVLARADRMGQSSPAPRGSPS